MAMDLMASRDTLFCRVGEIKCVVLKSFDTYKVR